MDYIEELLTFIGRSPTAFHAVGNIVAMLSERGFRALNECEDWALEPGGRYYVTRNQSSVIAFRVPEGEADHFQIVASHSDSPCFKLKPASARTINGYATLNVEKYGGMIMSTWFDRPLSVAGRAIVNTGAGFESRLVNLDRDLALIPNVPIHFNREVNDGVKLNAQVDMLPVYGAAGSDLTALVAAALGVRKEQIAGADLYLVNRDQPRLWGANREFIAAPRLDDLACAFASARALEEAAPSRHMDVLCVFDNEEVGSGTRQGADSSFLREVLGRVAAARGARSLEAMLARSMMLSADNAHAVHPNHPEKYDADNRAVMNGGVVVKFNASQKYTSDGVSMAVFRGICQKAGVPVQFFANRSDEAGGSTLGNIAMAHVSMNTVDLGLAQLAMHSSYETAGVKDLTYLKNASQAFYSSHFTVDTNGDVQVED